MCAENGLMFSRQSPLFRAAQTLTVALLLASGVSAEDAASTTNKQLPAVDVTDQYRLQRLYSREKFDCPVALAVVPGAEEFREAVLLQRGEIWLLHRDRVLGKPERFLDLRERQKNVILFEEGMHGLAFHPDFAANGKFYLSYSTVEPRRTVISEMHTQAGDPMRADVSSERILLELHHPMANHFGGGITFGPDKKLYIAIGDGGLRDDPYRLSQNPFLLYGKVIRIDVDKRTGDLPYGIPSNNPFFDKQEFRQEIWALGLRNPWGFSFDSQTGQLWLADVGQDSWEEVNLIQKGKNYGWSDRDGPHQSTFHERPFVPEQTYEDPLFAYDHSEGVSVTGGFVYHGSRLPKLDGCFIYGDWGVGALWGLRYEVDSQKLTERLHLVMRKEDATAPFNPTMIAADADGEMMLLSQEGAIYTLVDGSD